MKINNLIEEIEEKHGKIVKSNFTIAYWIHQANYFIELYKTKYPNDEILNKIYKQKNKCAAMMLKSGENNVKIYKRNNDKRSWLLVLSNDLEGVKYDIVVPYLYVKNQVDVDVLEETDVNKDMIYINDIEFKTSIYKRYNAKLNFCLDNMEKSRKKMIEKLK